MISLLSVIRPPLGPLIRSFWVGEVWLQSEACVTKNGKSEHAGLPQLINTWINSSCSANETMLIFALYKTEGVGVAGTSACQVKRA